MVNPSAFFQTIDDKKKEEKDVPTIDQSTTVTSSVAVKVRRSLQEFLYKVCYPLMGTQLQEIDSVTGRLAFISQATDRDSTQSTNPIYTTI